MSTNWRGGAWIQPCLEASGMLEVMDGLLEEELTRSCRSRLSEISLAELDSRLYLKQREMNMGLSLETSVPVLTVFLQAAELFSPR